LSGIGNQVQGVYCSTGGAIDLQCGDLPTIYPILSREEMAQLSAAPKADTAEELADRKSTRLNSSHVSISYAVFCLKKKSKQSFFCSSLYVPSYLCTLFSSFILFAPTITKSQKCTSTTYTTAFYVRSHTAN